MNTRSSGTRLLAAALAGLLPGAALAQGTAVRPQPKSSAATYAAMVNRVSAMTEDGQSIAMLERRRLALLNVLWEDTGRWLGSSVGPNISDVTIEVEMTVAGKKRTALMPVIRRPNFSDVTGDVPLDKLRIPTGNQAAGWKAGDPLSTITLREFLAEPARYLTLPQNGKIKGGSLLARRDSHALVSAQAAFLPVPAQGTATFWPVIFNYQSSRRNPAVLTLLVTRQGTSATIIDNVRDGLGNQGLGSWGQRLFLNAGGQRAPLTAERLSAVERTGVTSNGEPAASLGDDANLLMLVQIPLRYRQPRRHAMAEYKLDGGLEGLGSGSVASPAPEPSSRARRGVRSDVETAVLGHGPELGPYTELDGLTIERDPRFPVRVTIQFYQATSNGVLTAATVKSLAAQIRRVYRSADYVGSLVTPHGSEPSRPTAWEGISPRPPGTTWVDFPGLVQRAGDLGAPAVPPPGPWRAIAPGP
jgi:hypothetical protein